MTALAGVEIVLHPQTEAAAARYVKHPELPLLITGATGSGKAYFAATLAAQLVGAGHTTTAPHAYVTTVRITDKKSIPIAAIRDLQHTLTLTVPGDAARPIRRVAVIEDAHMMTIEAQNALLKTLEEPPENTAIILTASSVDAVLPTIQSRVRTLALLPPPGSALERHLIDRGFAAADIKRALLLSGDLPGLATALLEQDTDHPMVQATLHARGILQSTTYDRLVLVDALSKQRELCVHILYVLTHMSRMALLKPLSPAAADRWRRIMAASYRASEQLQHNAQTKLVLTNLMLAF